jgi:hypothetical protein
MAPKAKKAVKGKKAQPQKPELEAPPAEVCEAAGGVGQQALQEAKGKEGRPALKVEPGLATASTGGPEAATTQVAPPNPHPGIPPAENRKMLGVLKYMKKTGKNSIADDYSRMSPAEKRAFYWDTWRLDPKLAKYQAVQRDRKETKEEKGQMEGWLTVDQILQLNAVPESSPQRAALGKAFCAGLPSKDHPKPELAALGLKVYYYHHEGPTITTESKKRELEVTGEAEVDHDTYQAAVQGMGSGSSSSKPALPSSEPSNKHPCTDPAWMAGYKRELAAAKRTDKATGAKLSEARQAMVRLEAKLGELRAGKSSTSICEAYLKELGEKIELLSKAHSSLLTGLAGIMPPANETTAQRETQKIVAAKQEGAAHLQAFTAFFTAIGAYVGKV